MTNVVKCPISWNATNIAILKATREANLMLFKARDRGGMSLAQTELRAILDSTQLTLEAGYSRHGFYLGALILLSSDLDKYSSYEQLSATLKMRKHPTSMDDAASCACGKDNVEWMTTVQCDLNPVLIGSSCCCKTGIMSTIDFNKLKRAEQLVSCSKCSAVVKRKQLTKKMCSACTGIKCSICCVAIPTIKYGGKCAQCNMKALTGTCTSCGKACKSQFNECFSCSRKGT